MLPFPFKPEYLYSLRMDILLERYAELVVKSALKLAKGDVLSINTEEENSELAHYIAKLAKGITGNGSYIQNIENGKVTETEEAESEYPIDLRPSALLYLPVYRPFGKAEDGKLFTAPELQAFRHLSEPLDNPDPSIPFVTAPVPSAAWGEAIEEDGGIAEAAALLSDLLSLSEDSYLAEREEMEDVLIYERDRLNGREFMSCRISDEEGTDIEFSFLPGSVFAAGVLTLSSGRRFVPTVYASDIFRAIDPQSAEGYFTITHPIMVFGHIIRHLSCKVEKGRITDFTTDEESGRIFSLFLQQEENAGRISELIIAEEGTTASNTDIFALPEWDRMRSTALAIGGPRPESLRSDEARRGANDSLLSLTLPIGSDTTTITAKRADGDEEMIMEDGFLKEE